MNLTSVREGVTIAFDALRSNKVRAALTILGIVIGVATVMTMSAMISGLRSSITGELEQLGPKNFIVQRFDETQIQFVSDGTQRPPWHGKPPITVAEAEQIAALPSIGSVTISINASGSVRYGTKTAPNTNLLGRGPEWPSFTGGDFIAGRNFIASEDARSANVVVITDKVAEALFGETADPIGKSVRVSGESLEVIGVFKAKENIFSGLAGGWAVVPPSTAIKRLNADVRWISLLVVPAADAEQAVAMDDVTATLRAMRGLRPIDENNFAVVPQASFLDLFDRLTGAFVFVMLVLSSIGLMVGGVGVVAIMMISVTERTREIGVRKALGATRREILWQFLVESVTVTMVGGVLGLLVGGGGAALIAAVTPIPASVPLGTIVAAIIVFAIGGIVFGVGPAIRASRLDPVEALRYE